MYSKNYEDNKKERKYIHREISKIVDLKNIIPKIKIHGNKLTLN